MKTKLYFTANGEPDRERVVSVQVPIGTVYRTWFRFGGHCWTNSRNARQGFVTRGLAASDLLYRYDRDS